MTSAESALQAAGEAFERSRLHAATPAEAMADALATWDALRKTRRGRFYPIVRTGAVPDAAVAVIVHVARCHGVSVGQLRSHQRKTPLIIAVRDEAVYVVRTAFPGISYPTLGRFFERDHASLVVGMARFEARLASDEVLAARMRKLVEGLPSGAVVAEQVAGGVA